MSKATNETGRKKTTHPGRWVAGIVALGSLLGWAGMSLIGRQVVGKMDGKLAENGLVLERKGVTWDPLRGLHFEGARLCRMNGQQLMAVSSGAVGFPLDQFFKNSALITDWRLRGADVSLYDAEGEVKLEDVSVALRVKGEEVTVDSVSARKDGLKATLVGQVSLDKPEKTAQPVEWELRTVRATLEALDMQRGRGLFEITGKFRVDARPAEVQWSAELKGRGEDVVWKDIPLEEATAEAKLTAGKSIVTANLVLPHGRVDFSITRKDWEEAPFVFQGKLRDGQGREDAFHGNYSTKSHELTVEKLDGAADLWALARDVPRVAAALPEEVGFQTFPEVSVRNLERVKERDGVRWSVEQAELKGKMVVSLKNERKLEISNVSGGVEYDGRTWKLENVEGRLLGGSMAVSGGYRGKELHAAKVAMEGVKLSELKQWMEGEASTSNGVLYVEYRGDVDPVGKTLEGHGTMRLENAPVIETPLLDETYDLFSQLIPGVERAKMGEFQAEFTGKGKRVEVTKFEAKGGALTVSAKGIINLETERVKGSARGKLGGIPGLVTSPLSRLLEMNVEGPVDNIRVKPLGPVKLVSNLASGTVGVAVDTMEETGRITGEVLKDGVKLPMKWFQKKK